MDIFEELIKKCPAFVEYANSDFTEFRSRPLPVVSSFSENYFTIFSPSSPGSPK
jgi:hypothetical protein